MVPAFLAFSLRRRKRGSVAAHPCLEVNSLLNPSVRKHPLVDQRIALVALCDLTKVFEYPGIDLQIQAFAEDLLVDKFRLIHSNHDLLVIEGMKYDLQRIHFFGSASICIFT